MQNTTFFYSLINRCKFNSKIGQTHLEFPKKRELLAEVDKDGTAQVKATEKPAQCIALFYKTYRGLFDETPEFKLRLLFFIKPIQKSYL